MEPSLNLIFDWGGVLADDDSEIAARHLSKKYSCDFSKLKSLLSDEDNYSTSNDYKGFILNIQEFVDIPESEIIEWKNNTLPNKTFDLCHSLKAKGVEMYLLSDQMQFRTSYIRENYDLSCFKKSFFSSEIGFLKNDPRSFKHLIKETGITPSNSLFIDDWQKNIDVAKGLELRGYLYTDLQNLILRLKREGFE